MDDPGSQRMGVVPREVLLGEDGLSFLQGLISGRHPRPPFSVTTDILLVEAEAGRVVFEGTPNGAFFNPIGSIHGGWTAALLDSAMACAVHTLLKPGQGYTTVEMKLNYVRPVQPDLGTLRCEGRIVHAGATLATAEGRVLDGRGRLIAHGTETCLIMQMGTPA